MATVFSYWHCGEEYINTFPFEWIEICRGVMGPNYCETCRAQGCVIINSTQIFVCFCFKCAVTLGSKKLQELATIVDNLEDLPFISSETMYYLVNITRTDYYVEGAVDPDEDEDEEKKPYCHGCDMLSQGRGGENQLGHACLYPEFNDI